MYQLQKWGVCVVEMGGMYQMQKQVVIEDNTILKNISPQPLNSLLVNTAPCNEATSARAP